MKKSKHRRECRPLSGKEPVAKSHKANIWEQCRRHALASAKYIHCAPERARRKQETPIGRRFTSEVGISSRKYHCLRGRARVRLTPATTIIGVSVAPTGEPLLPPKQSSVLQERCCTHLCQRRIVARELQVVLRAFHVAEERSLRQPARSGYRLLCNLRFAPNETGARSTITRRHRRYGGLRHQRDGHSPFVHRLDSGEAHSVGDIATASPSVSILTSYTASARKLRRGAQEGFRRQTVHVHDQDRFLSLEFGKAYNP